MKKICFSNPTVMLKRPIAEIIMQLKGNSIYLLTPKDLIKGTINIHYDKVKNIKIYNYSIINPPIVSSEWPIPINPLFFFSVIKRLKYSDIIHLWVPFYISNMSLILFKRLFFPKKALYITMDTFPGLSFSMNKIMDMLFRIYYKTIGKFIFSAATKIILYGNSMKKFALQVGIQEEKIEVIPTGVNVNTKNKTGDIRKEFHINENSKIVLYVGLLNERKGIDIFINTALRLKNQNITFIIVGDGPNRKEFEKQASLNNLTEKIIFTGFRKDVHNFFQGSDLFFFPSRGEGLAGVIMESMIYGLPIVTSDIAGTRDLIKNGYNGFLCKSEDIKDFSQKIEILLKDEGTRNNFIKNSKEKITTSYNWSINIRQLKRLYNCN